MPRASMCVEIRAAHSAKVQPTGAGAAAARVSMSRNDTVDESSAVAVLDVAAAAANDATVTDNNGSHRHLPLRRYIRVLTYLS